MTPNKPRRKLSVLVAITGLPVMLLTLQPRQASAQYPTGGNGHLLDANNQLGSGGQNGTAPSHYGNPGLNNDIISGNVTGLNYFHGSAASINPNTFQGRPTKQGFVTAFSSPSDRLNALSAPVDYAARTTGTPNYTSYYAADRYTAPVPSNLTLTPGSNTLLPTPTVDPLVPSTDNRLTTLLDPMRGNLPMQGELNVSGPVDPTGAASLYSMSPLYGVRSLDNTNTTGDSFLQSRQNTGQINGMLQRAQMTPAQIEQMRQELNKTVVPDDQNANPANPNATPGTSSELNNSSKVTNPAIGTQLPAQNLAATDQPGNPAVTGGPNNLNTGQGLQSNALIPANKQSGQIKALEEKYSKLNHKMTDAEAAAKLNAEERLLHSTAPDKTIKKPGQPTEGPGAVPAPGAMPGAGSTPNLTPREGGATTRPEIKPILTTPDSAADNQPYVITSLATDIHAKGLGDLMKSAEDKMRQGKFTEAVDTYETAQAVAPNNPFIFLGRSFAELGASYYGKADQDMTRAVAAEPALLAGKYDLNGFLGGDRVKFVLKDLQDIANHEKSGRPLVLLGFIAHNTGDDEAAAKYLNQAGPRGGYDSIIALMRSTWGLKSPAK